MDSDNTSLTVAQSIKSNAKRYKSCNTLPPSLQQFLKRATRICKDEQRTFSVGDYPHLSKGNFRISISRLHEYIEPISEKTHPQFYKIKRIDLPGSSHSVTVRPMRVVPEILEIMEELKEQPASIHDIKIKIETDMHSELVKN